MQKLHLNQSANLFILSTYAKTKREVVTTPFGTVPVVYVNKILKPSKKSEIGTESYRASLSRAFNRAKQKIYFNPDMTQFVTLTYKENMQDTEKLLYDVKQLLKKESRHGSKDQKYIYIIERQERGALHVHMIANEFLTTHKNKNGYPSCTYWTHGFSSVLDIKGADSNFKPYLYLFKYMKKAQRIGNRFVYSSNSVNNFDYYTDFEFEKKLYDLQFTENVQLGILDRKIKKQYYKKRTPPIDDGV